jgi:hypothetical protein
MQLKIYNEIYEKAIVSPNFLKLVTIDDIHWGDQNDPKTIEINLDHNTRIVVHPRMLTVEFSNLLFNT